MKDEMMQALTAFVTKMVGILDSAVDAGAQQLPEVLGELLLLARVQSVVGIAAWCVGVVVVMILCINLYRNWANWADGNREEWIGVHVALAACIGTAIFFCALEGFRSAMKPLIAPRAYLIEYCAQLVK
jgi:hypothetical protein